MGCRRDASERIIFLCVIAEGQTLLLVTQWSWVLFHIFSRTELSVRGKSPIKPVSDNSGCK